ncbi:MAG: hypothetical protein ABSF85_00795 [Terriglobales bacterium]|jgi:predicted RNase H-like nuclease (RuvC/YqgF family)
MFMPIGFIRPLKKENEALRKQIGELRKEIESLKGKPLKKENEALQKEIEDLRVEFTELAALKLAALKPEAFELEKILANFKEVKPEKILFEDTKPAEARSFRSSGNSDAAMLSGR